MNNHGRRKFPEPENLHTKIIFPMRAPNTGALVMVCWRQRLPLRRQIEAVAAQRRALPPGGEVPEDYVFEEGDNALRVRMSQLFGGKPTLIAYSFMYGPGMDHACPACTSILDALDGEMPHVTQRASLVVVAKSPIARIMTHAKQRGWRTLRLLSSAANSYNADYHGENAKGEQISMLNVFTLKGGVVRHSFGTEMHSSPSEPGQDPRHVDSIWPLWSLLDFTPEGRGDFHPKLQYADGTPA
jgi:predicted dithiol-disulfide oxidoreductase (DUF899 family)